MNQQVIRQTMAVKSRPQWRAGRSRRKGSTIVMISLAMMSLLGLCAISIDYGFLVNDANRLQRASDAAALAGAQELKKTVAGGSVTQTAADYTDTTAAYNRALQVANQNGIPSSQISAINFLNNNTQVRVMTTQTRTFFFGRAIGVPSGRVTRQATAGVTAVSSGNTGSVAPIGITQETYDAYRGDSTISRDITLIRQNKTVFRRDPTDVIDPDPMVLFDLRSHNGKSPAHFQRELTGEEVVPASIGDEETTLNANLQAQAPNFKDGFTSIFARAAQAPWNDPPSGMASDDWRTVGTQANAIIAGTVLKDNPRVINLIVTPSTSVSQQGTFDTTVSNFAPVYVEEVYDDTYYQFPDGRISRGNPQNNPNVTTITVTRLKVRFLPPQNLSSGDTNFTIGTPGANLTGSRFIQLVG